MGLGKELARTAYWAEEEEKQKKKEKGPGS